MKKTSERKKRTEIRRLISLEIFKCQIENFVLNVQKTSRLPFICHRHPEPIIFIILTRLRAHSAVLVTASEADILSSGYRTIATHTPLKGSWKKVV